MLDLRLRYAVMVVVENLPFDGLQMYQMQCLKCTTSQAIPRLPNNLMNLFEIAFAHLLGFTVNHPFPPSFLLRQPQPYMGRILCLKTDSF